MNRAAALALVSLCAFSARAQQATGSLAVNAVVQGSVGLRVLAPFEAQTAAETVSVPIAVDGRSSANEVPVTLRVIRANVSGPVSLAVRLDQAAERPTTWTIKRQMLDEHVPLLIQVNDATVTFVVKIEGLAGRSTSNRLMITAH